MRCSRPVPIAVFLNAKALHLKFVADILAWATRSAAMEIGL